MPAPRAEALALGEVWRLALGYDPRRGPAGERLSRGTGSSLEFQDRRDYAAGDDVRHLDWRALARTDTMLVRQYREEVLPQLELLVDASHSMAVDGAKAGLALDLAATLASAARAEGFRTSVVLLGEHAERVDSHVFLAHGVDFEAGSGLAEVLRQAGGLLRAGSLRVCVSDFLSPHDPAVLVRGLARGSGGLALLQVLAHADLEPPEDAALRLTDAESGEELDLVLDGRIRGRYLDRFERLVEGLRSECLRHGATFAQLDAAEGIDEHLRGVLSDEGVVLPA